MVQNEAAARFRQLFPQFASEADRLAHYARMRHERPIAGSPETGFWSVYRYEDVRRVLTDHHAFSSEFAAEGGFLRRTLLNSDPPRHTELRGLVTRAFTPRAVERMAPLIGRLTQQSLEPALRRGSMEVTGELARPLPIGIIAAMLGLPTEDEPRFRVWSEAFNGSGEQRFQGMQEEMDAYFRPLLQRQQGEGLVADLVRAELAGEDLLAFCELLLLAGFVTTTNLIGNGMWLLSQHPEVLPRLRADPSRVPAFVEEVLRIASPVQAFVRRAAREVSIAGATIPADARVLAWIGSANLDKDAFADADRFLPDRDPNPHLAFGHGIHFCLGAPLARLEGRIAFAEVAQRVATITGPEQEPAFTPGFLHGPTRLDVQLAAVR